MQSSYLLMSVLSSKARSFVTKKSWYPTKPLNGVIRRTDATLATLNTNASKNKYSVIINKIIRGARIIFLGFAIWNSGYYVGVKNYALDPVGMEKSLLKSSLPKGGNGEALKVSYLSCDTTEHRRIYNISMDIVNIAKSVARDRILYLQHELHTNKVLNDNIELKDKLSNELIFWLLRQRQLDGDWGVVMIHSPIPNAFVSSLLPKRIFVHTGIIDTLQATDDEIAVILGHEVSHLLLDHMDAKEKLNANLSITLLMLMAFIDSTGLLSFFIDSLLLYFSFLISKKYCRDEEVEADVFGVYLAASACYDTERGSNIFNKIHNASRNTATTITAATVSSTSTITGTTTSPTFEGPTETEVINDSWNSTHPNSHNRYLLLKKLSRHINSSTYCKKRISFYDLIRGARIASGSAYMMPSEVSEIISQRIPQYNDKYVVANDSNDRIAKLITK